jgi:hypothetical protein
VTTKTVKSIPNIQSWRCIQVGNAFTATRNMETNSVYGWGTIGSGIDTHLMKNTEWGAVAYLSKSNYGQDLNEIWINNSSTYITGCAGSSVSAASSGGCQNTYETTNGVKASTTGNIYGIYDMSGGSYEYLAAYVNNANDYLGQGSSIIDAASQYKDVYTVGTTDDQASNYALSINFKGDAIYETSYSYSGTNSWYGDYSYITYTTFPWFLRGGNWSQGSSAGVFTFYRIRGTGLSTISFRPVLAVNTEL